MAFCEHVFAEFNKWFFLSKVYLVVPIMRKSAMLAPKLGKRECKIRMYGTKKFSQDFISKYRLQYKILTVALIQTIAVTKVEYLIIEFKFCLLEMNFHANFFLEIIPQPLVMIAAKVMNINAHIPD